MINGNSPLGGHSSPMLPLKNFPSQMQKHYQFLKTLPQRAKRDERAKRAREEKANKANNEKRANNAKKAKIANTPKHGSSLRALTMTNKDIKVNNGFRFNRETKKNLKKWKKEFAKKHLSPRKAENSRQLKKGNLYPAVDNNGGLRCKRYVPKVPKRAKQRFS